LALALGAAALAACATASDGGGGGTASGAAGPASGGAPSGGARLGTTPVIATATTAALGGARCQGATCRCRESRNDDAETAPPAEGSKRFEIRMSADGGTASMEISGVGTVIASGLKEACYYLDLPAGGSHDVVFAAREATKNAGIAPVLRMAEYGPSGPYWYDVLTVTCNGPDSRCDRRAAGDWGQMVRQYKRGRADPCGSTVLRGVGWDTSRTQGDREGGLFHDFAVRFTMEVKTFATQFAPGSTQCVPK
jgi:hypothetical protein